jgi:hypothetical protein
LCKAMVVDQIAGNGALARADAWRFACQNELGKKEGRGGKLLPQMPINIAVLVAMVALLPRTKPTKTLSKVDAPDICCQILTPSRQVRPGRVPAANLRVQPSAKPLASWTSTGD